MKFLATALAVALLVAGGAASAACNGHTAEKPVPGTTAELPVLPPEKAGS